MKQPLYDVALVNMPFAALESPSIALGILKSSLLENGHSVHVYNFNLDFASKIGLDDYNQLWDLPAYDLIGEFIFRNCFLPLDENSYNSFINDIVLGGSAFHSTDLNIKATQTFLSRIKKYIALAKDFIQEKLSSVDWNNYSAIAFTSTFQQNFSSLALAQEIKFRYSNPKIIFGGANFEDSLGKGFIEAFECIDAVCLGRGEVSFPKYIKKISQESVISSFDNILVQGDVSKRLEYSNEGLLSWKIPDYDDYFESISKYNFSFSGKDPLRIPFETSKGCWWGEKHHCTFCGLNGKEMKYSSKPAEMVIEELNYFESKYKNKFNFFFCVDNIIPYSYFHSLFRKIGSSKRIFFFETKVNLKEDEVKSLRKVKANFIQPGIESLNTGFLKLIDKGTSQLINVYTLKLCKTYGVTPLWNLLAHIPFERECNYENQIELIPKITHLMPPATSKINRVRFDKFSPYYKNAHKYGIHELKPYPSYYYLYDFIPDNSIREIAYFFTGSFDTDVRPEIFAELNSTISEWRQKNTSSHLVHRELDSSVIIIDTRGEIPRYFQLRGVSKDILLTLSKVTSFSTLAEILTRKSYDIEDIKHELKFLTDNNIVIQEDSNFLSISVELNPYYGNDVSSYSYLNELLLDFEPDKVSVQ